MGFRVWGSGFRVRGLGFRVYGLRSDPIAPNSKVHRIGGILGTAHIITVMSQVWFEVFGPNGAQQMTMTLPTPHMGPAFLGFIPP